MGPLSRNLGIRYGCSCFSAKFQPSLRREGSETQEERESRDIACANCCPCTRKRNPTCPGSLVSSAALTRDTHHVDSRTLHTVLCACSETWGRSMGTQRTNYGIHPAAQENKMNKMLIRDTSPVAGHQVAPGDPGPTTATDPHTHTCTHTHTHTHTPDQLLKDQLNSYTLRASRKMGNKLCTRNSDGPRGPSCLGCRLFPAIRHCRTPWGGSNKWYFAPQEECCCLGCSNLTLQPEWQIERHLRLKLV